MTKQATPVSYQLKNEWTIWFQVKQRESLQYHKTDFFNSFIQIGEKSKELKTILDQYFVIPKMSERLRGMFAIFKDDIQPLYEHEKNKQMTIIKFSISKDRESFEQLKKKAEEENDQKVISKLAPYFEKKDDLDQFIDFLVISLLLGKLETEKNKGCLNGFYIKLEEGWIGIELWYNTQNTPDNKVEDEEKLLRELLNQLKVMPIQFKKDNKITEYTSLANTITTSNSSSFDKKNNQRKDRYLSQNSQRSTNTYGNRKRYGPDNNYKKQQ